MENSARRVQKELISEYFKAVEELKKKQIHTEYSLKEAKDKITH